MKKRGRKKNKHRIYVENNNDENNNGGGGSDGDDQELPRRQGSVGVGKSGGKCGGDGRMRGEEWTRGGEMI